MHVSRTAFCIFSPEQENIMPIKKGCTRTRKKPAKRQGVTIVFEPADMLEFSIAEESASHTSRPKLKLVLSHDLPAAGL